MARTYKRDSRGRFAGGGGSSRGGGRKQLQRGTNRLTRDNAGRITSVGGDGATARGGRLRTASGRQRATVTAKGIGKAPAGTVGRSGRVKAPARVKAAGRRAPLTGVNAVVARNPAGFKGLPVSLRSRSAAAAAQRQRNERLVRATRNLRSGYTVEFSRGGVGKVVVGSMRIRKGKSEQGNLLTGKTETVVSGRRITMSGRSALGRRAKPAAAAKPARVGAKPVAAKPPAGSFAATKQQWAKGQAAVLSKQKSSLNKQLKEINAKIKEAGPNAGGLRLQKLQIQDRLNETRRGIASARAAAK